MEFSYEDSLKAKHDSDRTYREKWIRSKYIDKCFVKPIVLEQDRKSYKRWTVASLRLE